MLTCEKAQEVRVASGRTDQTWHAGEEGGTHMAPVGRRSQGPLAVAFSMWYLGAPVGPCSQLERRDCAMRRAVGTACARTGRAQQARRRHRPQGAFATQIKLVLPQPSPWLPARLVAEAWGWAGGVLVSVLRNAGCRATCGLGTCDRFLCSGRRQATAASAASPLPCSHRQASSAPGSRRQRPGSAPWAAAASAVAAGRSVAAAAGRRRQPRHEQVGGTVAATAAAAAGPEVAPGGGKMATDSRLLGASSGGQRGPGRRPWGRGRRAGAASRGPDCAVRAL